MKDATTGCSLIVSTDGGAGPYMILPADLLDKVTSLLDENQISYWVDEELISVDGGPEDAFINFKRGSDPADIQRILDSAL